jgi:transcriptional regulator with XRE-family HTH domain
MDDARIGVRIARTRKLLGLTQEQLAQRTHYSIYTLRAVEQGREPASPAFTAAAARALGVDPEELLGLPHISVEHPDGTYLDALIKIRRVLAEGAYVRAVEPGSLTELARLVHETGQGYQKNQGQQAAEHIPDLIRRLHGAVREAANDADRGRAYALLSSAYCTADRLCRLFGHVSLCSTTIDRMEWAAAHSDDPTLSTLAKIKRARGLMYLDSLDVSASIIEQALADVDSQGQDVIIKGHAHLCGSIIAARSHNLNLAYDHIREARAVARHVKDASDTYSTCFGIGNVEIHAVAVELEAGDPGKAASEGTALHIPPDVAALRVGHHWQDTARAWLLTGETQKALQALNRARQVAPEQTRLHPSIRETIRAIAEAERRRTDSLVTFSHWLGIRI